MVRNSVKKLTRKNDFNLPPPLYVVFVDRYIGGLRGDNPVKVSNWERELNPRMLAPPNPSRVPIHWLGGGVGAHADALTALHSLRDLMVKDTLNLELSYQL